MFTYDDFEKHYKHITLGMSIHIKTHEGTSNINGYVKMTCLADFKTDTVSIHLTDLVTDPIGVKAKHGWIFSDAAVPAVPLELHQQYILLLQFSTHELEADINWKSRFKSYLDQTNVQLLEVINACQMTNEKNQMVQLSAFATTQISNFYYIN